MSSLAYQQHLERLDRLYYEHPLLLFDFEDLESIVHSFRTVFDDALQRKAVHPYMEEADGLLAKLTVMRQDVGEFRREDSKELPFRCYGIQFEDHIFNIPVAHGDIQEALVALYPLISQSQEKVDALTNLNSTAEKDITYTIQPNKIVGKKYLVEARFFIPLLQPKEGVYVFLVKSSPSQAGLSFEVQPSPGVLYTEMDQALRRETDPNRLETVIVAKGTEEYPLAETILPIIFRRYVEGLGFGERN